MNFFSWLDLFIFILFSCTREVFSVKSGSEFLQGKLNSIRTKCFTPKIQKEKQKDSNLNIVNVQLLGPILNSPEVISIIRDTADNFLKCAQRCSIKASRSQITAGLCAIAAGYALKKINIENFKCGDICRISKRYGSAIATTASICADFRLHQIFEDDLTECHQRAAIKLSKLFAKNGGLYIKAAQHLSAMDHLLPDVYVRELTHLQDQAPATPIEIIEELFQSELGKDFNEIFSDFCNVPIGSASIGQVHLAKLKSSGEQVAVKIQHPNIERDAEIDLWALNSALKIVKLIFPSFDLDWLVDEVRSCLDSELNFKTEAMNSKIAKESFDKNPKLKKLVLIPKVYDEFTTERILIMEYISGYKINDIKSIEASKIDPESVNNLMYEVFMEMFFKHQFVHCDPHPGNILINHNPKSGQVKIVLLDHGIYKPVTPQIVKTFSRVFLALLSQNEDEIELIATELRIDPEILAHFNSLVKKMTRAYCDKVDPDELNYKLRTEIINLMLGKDGVSVRRQASDTLKSLPREILFLIKILDLLRSNERSLTRNSGPYKRILPESLMIIAGYSVEAVEGKTGFRNSFSIYLKLLEAFNRRRWN